MGNVLKMTYATWPYVSAICMRELRGKRPRVCRAGAFLVTLCALGAGTPAIASEGGQIEYPIGVNTVLTAVRPPPGETRYYNYLLGYDAGETTNSQGKSAVPNFNLYAIANAARMMHTWDVLENDFSLTTAIVVPIVDTRVVAGSQSKEIFGVGDANLQQYLNWHNAERSLFLSAGLTLWFPTGRYNPTRLVNTGLNRYTLAPELDATWLINQSWEATITTVLEQNFTNPATHYLSGHDSTTDFSIMYTPASYSWVQFGLNGYFYQQIDNDTRNGVAVADTDRARVAALGPQVRFDLGEWGVAFKLQHEFAAQLKPEGNRFWFQFTVPVSL
jgi:hypothetical protein